MVAALVFAVPFLIAVCMLGASVGLLIIEFFLVHVRRKGDVSRALLLAARVVAFFSGGAAAVIPGIRVYWAGLKADGDSLFFYGWPGDAIWVATLAIGILAVALSWLTARIARRD
jgi:hypothetical protein